MQAKHHMIAAIFAAVLAAGPASALAQAHAGQMDTDGILSPGEIENPNIDYERAQRQRLRSGDFRADNPDNDRAAADDWRAKRDQEYERGRYRWYYDDYWRSRRDDDRRYRDRSWFDW